ncbi:protein NETWORKED 3A-like [Argentina anserina]|uniref:protein NETWORKED 3A-like n=1 Tax=Argentina anserina TaxID=57926 RepID=UPI0021767616|nr:protein NETWORKED 3A-like [Potentilla anserina]
MVDSKETSVVNKEDNAAAFSWWWDSHNRPHHSQWLQATLSDVDEKTKLMLNIIEEDGDTFAKRADMFFKRKPELITRLEDFYKSYRSLAENYDQLRSEVIQAAHLRSFSTLDSIKAQTIQKCEKEISGYMKVKALPNSTIEKETTSSSDDAIEYLHKRVDNRLVLVSSDQQDSSAGSDKDMKAEELDGSMDEKICSIEKAKIWEEKVSELIDANRHQQEKLISNIKDKSETIKKLNEENRILRAQLLARTTHTKNNELPKSKSKSKGPSFIGRLTGCTKSP